MHFTKFADFNVAKCSSKVYVEIRMPSTQVATSGSVAPRARSTFLVNPRGKYFQAESFPTKIPRATVRIAKGCYALVLFCDRDLVESCYQIQLREVLLPSESRENALHFSQATTVQYQETLNSQPVHTHSQRPVLFQTHGICAAQGNFGGRMMPRSNSLSTSVRII